MTTPSDPDLVEIRLLDMALTVGERSQQLGADMMRELALITIGNDSGSTGPRRGVTGAVPRPAPQRAQTGRCSAPASELSTRCWTRRA